MTKTREIESPTESILTCFDCGHLVYLSKAALDVDTGDAYCGCQPDREIRTTVGNALPVEKAAPQVEALPEAWADHWLITWRARAPIYEQRHTMNDLIADMFADLPWVPNKSTRVLQAVAKHEDLEITTKIVRHHFHRIDLTKEVHDMLAERGGE